MRRQAESQLLILFVENSAVSRVRALRNAFPRQDFLPSVLPLKGFHRYEPLMHHPITRMGSPIDSWAGSACYPRRTFYPLSDGPSIQNRRITNSYFRTCSTCLSHSQAGLCVYTLRLISKQPEPTFERLRYNLGGDRPSQTTRLIVSLNRITALG